MVGGCGGSGVDAAAAIDGLDERAVAGGDTLILTPWPRSRAARAVRSPDNGLKIGAVGGKKGDGLVPANPAEADAVPDGGAAKAGGGIMGSMPGGLSGSP